MLPIILDSIKNISSFIKAKFIRSSIISKSYNNCCILIIKENTGKKIQKNQIIFINFDM